MSAGRLEGKVALVTGGARRIGRAIALALADAGADVAITHRTSHVEAKQVIATIQKTGRQALAVEADVRSETLVRAAVAAVVEQFGRIDVLVNSAGVFESVPLSEMTIQQWDAVFETNARGPFLVSREAHPYLKANRGRIINLGSLGGMRAWAGHAHYCASKAALHMLTQAMAKGFAPEVTVNCVAPGWIEMEEEAARGEELTGHFAAKTPMQRNGTAEDVARAVVFFAGDSTFVTGQILTVDGGLSL